MATDFPSDALGDTTDTVRLRLGTEDVVIATSYEVRISVLTQPAAFSLKLGHGDVAKEIIRRYPAKTPFALYINKALQFTGETDGYEVSGDGGATEVTIKGRDSLAPLHDAYVSADQSHDNATYADIVIESLTQVGLTNTLIFSNEANRKAVTGVNVRQIVDPNSEAKDPVVATEITKKVIQAKVGERRYEFLKRQLDRAGLFLWAGADGQFILSEPNANQVPTYRILRQRGLDRDAVNATRAHYKNETTGRYSEAIIYGRGGGKKFGRQKSRGAFVDEEMFDMGYRRPLVHRDVNVTNDRQAEFYARRVLAETRRAGWQLIYTMAGHTVECLQGGRAVWAPDTCVDVQDDEFGLKGTYWIESVVHKRGPETTTEITLMRPDDLIFASEAA